MDSHAQSRKLKSIALSNTRSTLLAYAVAAFVYSPMVVLTELTSVPYWTFALMYLITATFVLANLAAIRLIPKISYEMGAPILYIQVAFFMVMFLCWIVLLERGRYFGLFFAISMLIYTYSYGSKRFAISLNTSLIMVYLIGSYYTLTLMGETAKFKYDLLAIAVFLPTSIVVGRAGSKLALRKRRVKALLAEQKKTEQQLQETLIKLELAATTDELTGLINRREFNTRIQQEFNKMKRNHSNMCLLILDLDHFKQVNDNYGHPCGDAVLKTVANRLSNAFRNTDSVARWGGEEFIVLMPETLIEDAIKVSNRAIEAVSRSSIRFDGLSLSIIVSGGLLEVETTMGIKQALQNADELLYEAKRQGRNRIVNSLMFDQVNKKTAS